MFFNKTNNLILLFFMVFNTCINAQLQLVVDFTSSISYSNYQCGDLNVYPPCKSISDAGERSRQYINSINTPTVNPSLEIKLRNGISNPIIYGSFNELGNLFGFCSISVYVDTPVGSYITLDGSASNGPFISLEEPLSLNSNIQCTAGVSMNIKFLNFYNWGENEILYFGVDQAFNVATNKVVTIQNVNVVNSSKVFIVQPKYSTIEYNSIKITFKACNFESLYSSNLSLLPPFYLRGVATTFNNCKIINSVLDSSELIFIEMGSLTLSFTFTMTDVDVNPNYPVVSTLNMGTKYLIKLGSWVLNNCSFSNILYQRNTLPTTENPSYQSIELMKLYNCNILSSTLGFNSFLYYEQSFNDQLEYKFLGSSSYWDNTTISSGKTFVYVKNINLYQVTSNVENNVSFFDNLFISYNSNINLFAISSNSNTPLVGSNTIMTLQTSNINYSNFNLCHNCIVKTLNEIIFDNTI